MGSEYWDSYLKELKLTREAKRIRKAESRERRLKLKAKRQNRKKRNYHPVNRNDPRVIKFKKAVLRRDGYKCVRCGSTICLQVHHIKSWDSHPRLRIRVSNGETLCIHCHSDNHDWMPDHPNVMHMESIKQEIRSSK